MAHGFDIKFLLRFATNLFGHAGKILVDFVYPPTCILCDMHLPNDVALVCDTCWRHLPKVDNSLTVMRAGIHCSRSLALWSFEGGVQDMIHEMKFRRKMVLADRIGKDLASLLNHLPEIGKIDLIVPIPLHPTRLRERGFNQSALMARSISREAGLPMEPWALKRTRYTRAQSKLDAEERKKNVRHAFSVSENMNFSEKTILLVDDVTTTGATMEACAVMLKRAGASQVIALAGARTELSEPPNLK